MLTAFAGLIALVFAMALPDPLAALGPVPAGGARVYLVRHGQALSNLQPPPSVAPRGLDHLTALGEAQAEKVGQLLAGRDVKLVLSSPAGRAQETAERIARAIGVPTRVEPRLRPLEIGTDAAGKPLTFEARGAEWTAGRDPSPAGGESMAEMGHRVMAVVKGLPAAHPGVTAVLVAHGEVIGAFVGEVQGTPPPQRYPPRVANASLTVVDVSKDGTVALRFSNHLAPGMPTPAP